MCALKYFKKLKNLLDSVSLLFLFIIFIVKFDFKFIYYKFNLEKKVIYSYF